MAVRCRFVDQIATSPTVRLDLVAAPWQLNDKGTSFSPPPMRRSIVETIMRDGAEVPASAYENRIIVLRLYVTASSEDLLATALQNLNRELDRSRNILEFRSEGLTNSVFFRTFRSPDYDLDLEEVSGKHAAWLTLRLLAEPFAYGLMQSLSGVTVNNDPAAGSNGLFLDATGILGDVATPAIVQVDEPGADQTLLYMGVRRHGTPSDLTFFKQCESADSDHADTSTVADAAFSGGSKKRTTFATTTAMANRLSFTGSSFPLSSPTLAQARALRGTYRVLVRAAKTQITDTIKLRFSALGVGNWSVTSEPVALEETPALVDLGLIQFPPTIGVPGPGYSGIDAGSDSVLTFTLAAERVSGTGSLDWDFVMLMPADEELCIFDSGHGDLSGGGDVFFDGPNDAVYVAEDAWLSGGKVEYGAPGSRVGAIPMLQPNQTNRLYILQLRGAASSDEFRWTLTASKAFVVHYFPRWLYIRP